MNLRYTTVLFDLDGTLTDPKIGITNCIRYALIKLGAFDEKTAPTADELTWCIGPPLRASFKRILQTDSDEQAEQALALYRERFAPIGLFENELYPCIKELLADLKAAGACIVLATSKPQVYATRILQHFDLAQYFAAVFGAELDGTRDKKSELIAYALAQKGFDPRHAVMIGDRDVDVLGAHAHGIGAIGVSYGYGGRDELMLAQADVIAADVDELRGWLFVK
jgi:phosphoglycolate phosphatase